MSTPPDNSPSASANAVRAADGWWSGLLRSATKRPRSQNFWPGRFYWQTVKRWPALHAVCLCLGFFAGVAFLNLFWSPPSNDRQDIAMRWLGLFLLAGYGWGLAAFVLRLKRGTWKKHCDAGITQCSADLNGGPCVSQPRPPLKRFPSFLGALGFSWLCYMWCRLGVLVYHSALVVAKDEGAGFPDGLFIFVFIGWSILFLVIFAVTIFSWKQVWKPTTTKLKM